MNEAEEQRLRTGLNYKAKREVVEMYIELMKKYSKANHAIKIISQGK